ncbi:MAG: four helix bundle protein [bacterium]|nr:four helix bundle protein [bacterium]
MEDLEIKRKQQCPKIKKTRCKRQTMANNLLPDKNKKFDLEDRTTDFARKVIRMCKELPRNPMNDRLVGQVTGSSGSIGANYREANDALGKKDFIHSLKIARREAKETDHWLILLNEANTGKEKEFQALIEEAKEYKNIFSSIIQKME